MLGAFAGDFVGSRFEFFPIKSRDFDLVSEICRPTDDTILTIAVGDALVTGRDMGETLRMFAQSFPTSYDMDFREWFNGRLGSYEPYGSYGNDAAMRVSTAAWLATSFAECMELAERSTAVTHNHPEGIRGAKAVAAAIYAGLSGWPREDIKAFIERAFGYDLSRDLDEVMLESRFAPNSDISVPKALMCAFNADTVEDAIRNAVYLGGDCDTEGAIAGSIAETWSHVPQDVMDAFWKHIPGPLRKRIDDIQEKIELTVRAPLTREEADALAPWDPQLVEDWNEAMQAAEEKARAEEIAAQQEEIFRVKAESDRRDEIIRRGEESDRQTGGLSLIKRFIFRRVFV